MAQKPGSFTPSALCSTVSFTARLPSPSCGGQSFPSFSESPFGWHLLLLLLSHFSGVRHCATPETAAHQAPLSLGLSRQEHWSGLPVPSLKKSEDLAISGHIPKADLFKQNSGNSV